MRGNQIFRFVIMNPIGKINYNSRREEQDKPSFGESHHPNIHIVVCLCV